MILMMIAADGLTSKIRPKDNMFRVFIGGALIFYGIFNYERSGGNGWFLYIIMLGIFAITVGIYNEIQIEK